MSVDDMDDLGPVNIVVIGYPAGAPMTGEAAPLMLDLVDRGLIRVLDVKVVAKEEDGSYSGFEVEGIDQDRVGEFRAFAGASSGLIGDEDLAAVAEQLEPRETCVVIVYENRWAAPFAAAVRRSGGRLLASERVGVSDLLEALEQAEG